MRKWWGTLLPAPPGPSSGKRGGPTGRLTLGAGLWVRMQQGLGPEGPVAGGARGPCLGAGPNSIPQQPHACRRPVSNSSPGVTGSRGGAQVPPPRPTFQGSPGRLLHPLGSSSPLVWLGPLIRRGGRWEVENSGHSTEKLGGGEASRGSPSVRTQSRALGGRAEGGRGRGQAGPCLGPPAL